MTAILIIIALSEIAWAVWNYLKAEELAEKEEWLNRRDVSLDERANKLAQWENLLNERNRDEEGKRNATDDGQLVP